MSSNSGSSNMWEDPDLGPRPEWTGDWASHLAAMAVWSEKAWAAHDARTEATAAPDGSTVTGLVARVCDTVQSAAAVPIRDERLSLPNLGHPDLAEPSLIALARAAHAMDALLGRHLLGCDRAHSLPHDPVTTVAAVGISPSRARRLLAAARLADWLADPVPQLWADWAAGRLATDHICAMAAATEGKTQRATRDAVEAVLPGIAELSAAQVRKAVTAALAVADPDSAQTAEQDEYDARRLSITNTDDGIRISGVLPAVEGEALAALIEATVQSQRAAGDGLSMKQRRADALATIVAAAADTSQPSHGGLPAAVTMTIPAADADRVAGGQPRLSCTLGADAGGAGVPGSLAGRHLLGDGAARFGLCCADITPIAVAEPDSLAARLAGAGIEPLAVGRAQRLATTAQRKALALRDGGCVIEGCQVSAARCQAHHVTDWALGGKTDLDDLALLCWVHHRQVDLDRWHLERIDGRWHTAPNPRWRWRTQPREEYSAA